jgi:hypothetical protein
MEAAAARVVRMNLNANKPSIAAEAPTRAPRSDKGTKRTPKVRTLSIEAVSEMSTEEAQELILLVAARSETLKHWEDSREVTESRKADFTLAAEALQKFIESLAVGK